MQLRKQRIKMAFEAIKNAAGIYFVVLLMSSMILDGGLMFQGVLTLVGLHCALSILIMTFRFNRMTRADYMIISIGLFSGSASAPSFWFPRNKPKMDGD
jgi:hypothetical protein